MTSRDRPRLVDLAAHLDLAPSTVSRALAGSARVAAETRDRVVRAARELGYEVNPAASGLKRGQTLNLGLIAVINHWYTGAVTSGADRVAAEHGYDFVVMNSAGGADEDLLLARARRLGTRVDGVLIVDVACDQGLLDRLIDAVATPVVTLGCQAHGVSAVLVDNGEVGASAARHLAGLGHRRAVALASQRPAASAVENGSVRTAGFARAFVGDVVIADSLSVDATERPRQILEAAGSATAVFCASDALAIEAMALLRSAEVAVPGAVSVIGVDDHPLAQPLGLSTVAQQPERMGAIAVDRLVTEIRDGVGEPATITVPTRLLARASTAPPGFATLAEL